MYSHESVINSSTNKYKRIAQIFLLSIKISFLIWISKYAKYKAIKKKNISEGNNPKENISPYKLKGTYIFNLKFSFISYQPTAFPGKGFILIRNVFQFTTLVCNTWIVTEKPKIKI